MVMASLSDLVGFAAAAACELMVQRARDGRRCTYLASLFGHRDELHEYVEREDHIDRPVDEEQRVVYWSEQRNLKGRDCCGEQ